MRNSFQEDLDTRMATEMDEQLARLAGLPPDRPLQNLEAEVRRRITTLRRDHHLLQALAPIKLAVIGLSLVGGVAVGSYLATTAPASPSGLLLETAPLLAPSTLLEGHE
ncbi:MAG: hypothetical protein ABI645_00880 [Pseudomonadota bacterium]